MFIVLLMKNSFGMCVFIIVVDDNLCVLILFFVILVFL